MNVINHIRELKEHEQGLCLAIGVFDGVHLGHQQVIRQAVTDAEKHEAQSVVVTFDRHPHTVVAPKSTPPLIYNNAKKLRTLQALGVNTTLLIQFNKAFSQQPGEAFVRSLIHPHRAVHSISVGHDFRFGHRRQGDVNLLQSLGQELNFDVHGIASVSLDQDPVSSTRIREAISQGDFDAADQMLGRTYSLAGLIRKGDGVGRKLGFPTANLESDGLVIPPNGVYAVHARVNAQIHRGVLNIGFRPTRDQPSPQRHVETHLLDFQGDLYDQEMELTFVERLRDEVKFPSLEALQAQIGRDIETARRSFGS